MFTVRRVVPSVIVACALIIVLAACHPAASPSGSPSGSKKPTAAAAASPTSPATPTPAAVVQANAADYLLEGTPNVPDSNGEWDGHYGFWTDASHSVACDVWIFSGDSGGISCGITPGHENQRTYTLPAGIPATCQFDPGSSYQLDGTAIDINYKIFGSDTSNANVGFAGCLGDSAPSAVDALRKVLPTNVILTVTQTGFETYTCSVASAAASCSDSAPGSSFVFGLSTATFHQG
ncbi:MAG: hypothetical protein ABJA11_08615 [Pseudolysinimonas sp.]